MVLFLVIGPPYVNPGDCPVGQHLDSHLEGASSQWSASTPLGGVLPLSGTCPLGWGTAFANFLGKCLFISLFISFWETHLCSFYKGMDSYF